MSQSNTFSNKSRSWIKLCDTIKPSVATGQFVPPRAMKRDLALSYHSDFVTKEAKIEIENQESDSTTRRPISWPLDGILCSTETPCFGL